MEKELEEESKKVSKLLPCPFCGGDPYPGRDSNGLYTAKCFLCGVTMTQDRRDKLQGHWNQRKGETKTTE